MGGTLCVCLIFGYPGIFDTPPQNFPFPIHVEDESEHLQFIINVSIDSCRQKDRKDRTDSYLIPQNLL